MHEMAVCQALIDQLEALAADHAAQGVTRVVLRIGPLSGVEPALLSHAFELARAGTVAASAALEIEHLPVEVRCRCCQRTSQVAPNRLLCAYCGDYRTQLVSGDEMQLARAELAMPEDVPVQPPTSQRTSHV